LPNSAFLVDNRYHNPHVSLTEKNVAAARSPLETGKASPKGFSKSTRVNIYASIRKAIEITDAGSTSCPIG
ncbi:MAG: hypothetical protein N3B10_01930, partial [Armatimonadetes bacterium]|nr:hypothetical protein [Armatimonadota bacterium]